MSPAYCPRWQNCSSLVDLGTEDRQWVCLGVQHPLIQRQMVIRREEQVEVLEGLGKEETLLYVILLRMLRIDVLDSGVSAFRPTVLFQGLEE